MFRFREDSFRWCHGPCAEMRKIGPHNLASLNLDFEIVLLEPDMPYLVALKPRGLGGMLFTIENRAGKFNDQPGTLYFIVLAL